MNVFEHAKSPRSALGIQSGIGADAAMWASVRGMRSPGERRFAGSPEYGADQEVKPYRRRLTICFQRSAILHALGKLFCESLWKCRCAPLKHILPFALPCLACISPRVEAVSYII